MKWYQVKEQAAGVKRLTLLWYIYKFFGKNTAKLVIFFVTFFAFCFGGKIRKCSAEYLEVVKMKPSLLNQFRHFLSYSYSLLDKMESFVNRFDAKKIHFADEEIQKDFFEDVSRGHGVFFICSHLGNIDIMRSLLNIDEMSRHVHVNVFLSNSQCKIFNEFLKKISVKQNVTTFPVEEIGIDTPIKLKDKMNNGEIAFLAGDRVSQSESATFKTNFLNREVEFPLGAFIFAKLMEVPIYYIAALKEKSGNYTIYLEKANTKTLKENYVKFLEKLTLKYPLQFYHFYDLFAQK